MLVNILLTVLGCVLAVPVLISCIIRFLTNGFKFFKVKTRTSPPPILLDKKYGEHKFVSVNGVKLHYVESGDVTKPLVLFVHGFPEFWFSWRHQILHFNKNYHVVALDMRGYGESSKPSGISNYTLDLLVEDIRALVSSLGKQRFHLVAHDWGGIVSYSFAAKHPDMLQTYTACNIPHSLAIREQQRKSKEQMFKSWYVLFFQCPVLPELNCMSQDMRLFYSIMKDAGLHKDTELVEAYKYAFRDYTTWNRTINYYRAVVRNTFSSSNKQTNLNNIKVPVLHIFGTGDKYLSLAAAQGSAKYISDYRLELLPGVSHWVQQQEPNKVNSLIQTFIQQKTR